MHHTRSKKDLPIFGVHELEKSERRARNKKKSVIKKPDIKIHTSDTKEVMENPPSPVNHPSLETYFQPGAYENPSPISLPGDDDSHYEIRPHLIQSLPNIHGLSKEEPYNHLYEFLAICNTNNICGLTRDHLRLILFPFSLKG